MRTASAAEIELSVIHPAWYSHCGWLLLLAILTAMTAGSGIIFTGPIAALIIMSTRARQLTITDRRVVLRHGLFSKHTTEVRHVDVRNIQVSQGVLARLLGFGAIGISSAGQSGVEIAIGGIPDPEAVAESIRRLRG